MSRRTSFTDFQIFARAVGLADGEQRPLNEALFASFEPVRLWIRERAIEAPFKKLVILLTDETSARQWHGKVTNAIGVAQVVEAVDLVALRQRAGDHRWVMGIVLDALTHLAHSIGWRSDELERFIHDVSIAPMPLIHFFDTLAKIDEVSRMRCVPWLSTQSGETRVGVRIGDRDFPILSEPGPLYLEDAFPLSRSVVREREFVLLDKQGRVLAAVPIDEQRLH